MNNKLTVLYLSFGSLQITRMHYFKLQEGITQFLFLLYVLLVHNWLASLQTWSINKSQLTSVSAQVKSVGA